MEITRITADELAAIYGITFHAVIALVRKRRQVDGCSLPEAYTRIAQDLWNAHAAAR